MSAIRPACLFALAALMAIPAIYADGLKGDAAAGKALFMSSSCPTCHAVTTDDTSKVGPNLVGVVGRQAGTKKSLLGPSENMKKYGVIWSAKVPGTPMAGILPDPQQRADIIAFLSTLKE